MSRPSIQRTWFKHYQRDGLWHYFEVVGGPGKTKDGYQIVVNFLNDRPLLHTWHNYVNDTSGLTGTWCRYEVSTPISEEEFQEALQRALDHPLVEISDV